MIVSIIVPCYNAALKISRCLNSLTEITFSDELYEVIFVDDCSQDHTRDLLTQACGEHQNWRLVALDTNSGSPSRPRNVGLRAAKGEFVFFLDCDDEIVGDTLLIHSDEARNRQADVVRGNIIVNDGKLRREVNRISGWRDDLDKNKKIELIVAQQSLTKTSLFKRSMLLENEIVFPEDMKMGEDVVFVARALAAANTIAYIDHPTYVYNTMTGFVLSTTQSFGDKELADHLLMWPRLQVVFDAAGIDYFQMRLHVSFNYVVGLLRKKNRGDISASTFSEFANFVQDNIGTLRDLKLSEKARELVDIALAADRSSFAEWCKPRLLIAGEDLKFVLPLAERLTKFFVVKYDIWSGEAAHDNARSTELVEWADVVICEWLLGNAVWYSHNKRKDQILIVRFHRFELTRSFGEQVNLAAIDAFLAVSVHFFERLLERFPEIPRTKVRLLPNCVELDGYDRTWNEEKPFVLGMIGYLPSRKGLVRALSILRQLHGIDPRYRLEVFGRAPEEVKWIKGDRSEMAYFENCRQLIEEWGLSDAVTFNGHSDVREALSRKRVGIVLSTSQSMKELPGFESFHVAVADGFASGGVGLILHWLGAEYVWPQETIFKSEDALVDFILRLGKDLNKFESLSNWGFNFVKEHYSTEVVAENLQSIVAEFT